MTTNSVIPVDMDWRDGPRRDALPRPSCTEFVVASAAFTDAVNDSVAGRPSSMCRLRLVSKWCGVTFAPYLRPHLSAQGNLRLAALGLCAAFGLRSRRVPSHPHLHWETRHGNNDTG
jgi:hypothetical protein